MISRFPALMTCLLAGLAAAQELPGSRSLRGVITPYIWTCAYMTPDGNLWGCEDRLPQVYIEAGTRVSNGALTVAANVSLMASAEFWGQGIMPIVVPITLLPANDVVWRQNVVYTSPLWEWSIAIAERSISRFDGLSPTTKWIHRRKWFIGETW